MRKLTLLLLGVFLFASPIWAQRSISGTVTDDKGNPLANVSVVVKGTTTGTTTKMDGTYSLVLPANARTIVFSSVDMASQEINITESSTISVRMTTQARSMEEVIVVAYGTVKKGDFTGSASQVNSADFKTRPLTNVSNVLVGTISGLQTSGASGSPGSGVAIRIRGFGSVNAASDPLYVVDNVPYDGGLANLNLEDVESVTVLKDAATTALYGARAANGVIMITTKKGRKGRNTLNFKVTQGFSSRGLQEFDRVDAFQYYPLMWEAYRNSLLNHPTNPQPLATANQNATNDIKGLLGYNPFNVANNQIVGTDGKLNNNAQLLWPDDLDWEDRLVRQGLRTDATISMAGGADKSDYYMSIGYTDERGYLIRSDWRRFSGRLNVNSQPVNWFKMGINLSGASNQSNQQSGSGTAYVNPFFFSRGIGPIYPVYAHNQTTGEYLLDAEGNRFYDLGNMTSIGLPFRPGFGGRHIIAETEFNENLFKRNTLSARTYGDIIFTPWLKFTTNMSVDITDYVGQTYENTIVGDGAPGGRARKQSYKETTYTFNQLLTFNKKFNDHNFTVLAAHENYDYNYNFLDGFRQGQIADGNIELSNFTTTNSLTSRTDKARIESYFGRLNYDFDSKYFLSASARRDGNSKFSPQVRWASFWGAGLGWRVDREDFMKEITWINQLKLRSSYGQVGNEGGIDLYAYQALYGIANNALEPGFRQSSLPSPDLTWESAKTFDVGIDFTLFRNRINGSVEYYNRVTDRMIFDVAIPVSNGNYSISENIGSMYNRGIEFDIDATVYKTNDFTIEVGVTGATVKNRITKMPDQNEEIISGTKKLKEGQSIYDFWLREWKGVNPANGEAMYAANIWNASNSYVIGKDDTVTNSINNAKYKYMGSAIPDLYGGFTTTFRYKGFELSALFNYQIGGLVYDGAYGSLMHAGTYGSALHVDMLNRWQNPGDITNVPRMENSKTGVFDAASSRWLTNASFLNIRTVTLSYDIPRSLLGRINSTGASFFISGENLHVFSHRKGMNVNESFAGTTGNVYTPSRILTAGFNMNF